MEQSKSSVLFKRAIRTFGSVIAGAAVTAIGAVTLELAKGHTVSSFEDIKRLGISLIPVFSIAFFGAIAAAIDKAARWVEPDAPEPLDNEPLS